MAVPLTSIQHAFIPLADRRFRSLWLSSLLLNLGVQIHVIAQQWVMYDLTHAGSALGVTGTVAGLPLLAFSLVGGALADRFGKRRVMLVSQVGIMAIGLTIGTLITTGIVRPWHLIVLALFSGTCYAFNLPGRQAIIADLVKPHILMSAISLNAGAQNLSRTLGPALAGLLIARFGVALTYFLYPLAALLASVLLIPLPAAGATPLKRRSLAQDLREGLAYARRDALLMAQLLLGAAGSIFLLGYIILLPIMARAVLDVGVSGLGLMSAATGIGALIGSIVGAAMGDAGLTSRPMILAGLTSCALLAALSRAETPPIALLVLTLLGITNQVFVATNQTRIQSMVPDWVRGRVLGLYFMTTAIQPLAWAPIGVLADLIGLRTLLLVMPIAMLVALGAILLRTPKLWSA